LLPLDILLTRRHEPGLSPSTIPPPSRIPPLSLRNRQLKPVSLPSSVGQGKVEKMAADHGKSSPNRCVEKLILMM
jgi:hypothetical protein